MTAVSLQSMDYLSCWKRRTSESNVMLASTLPSEEEFDAVKQNDIGFCLILEQVTCLLEMLRC